MLPDAAAGRVETVRSHADAPSQIPWLLGWRRFRVEASTVVQPLHGHQRSDHLALLEHAVRVVQDGKRGQAVRWQMSVGDEGRGTQGDVTAEGMW